MRTGSGTRYAVIATLSTIVFVAIVITLVVTSSGWPEVKSAFFNGAEFRSSFSEIASAFLINVKIFCIAEAVILVAALGVAIVRGLEGPVFFPMRMLAIVYIDVFRGVPTILVIYLLGFGVPTLGLHGRAELAVLFWRSSR